MVDNILKPLIIGSRTRCRLSSSFSVSLADKGIRYYRPDYGPLIMAVFVSVFEIFRHVEDEISINREDSGKNEVS